MGSSLIALFFDFLFGEPPNRLHPTVWMGNYVAFLERLLYRRDGDFVARALGSLLVLIGRDGGVGGFRARMGAAPFRSGSFQLASRGGRGLLDDSGAFAGRTRAAGLA